MTSPNPAPTEHVYLSTACVHDRHVQCRQTCKFCMALCQCSCHPVVSTDGDDRHDTYRDESWLLSGTGGSDPRAETGGASR